MSKYVTYILQSRKDEKYYYGSTSNIINRVKKHNAGGVPSTKYRRPLALHYKEEFSTKKEASQREIFFKSIDGYNWLKQKRII